MVAIFVVLTILAFVSADAVIQMRRRRQMSALPAVSPAGARIRAIGDGLSIPNGLFLHPGHTWAEVHPTGKVRVGLDDFVRQVLGRPDRVTLLPCGAQVAQGEAMLTLERGMRRIVLPAPVSGAIQAANTALMAQPESLDSAPYQWAYTLRPSRLGEEISQLRIAEKASTWLSAELQRFTDWLTGLTAAHPVPALQDGGMPSVGVLAKLDDPEWAEFQAQFLEISQTSGPETT